MTIFPEGKIVVTGGAGFIGSNLAQRLLSSGTRVRILDNLVRRHVDRNLDWLRSQYGALCEVMIGDVRDRATIAQAIDGVGAVFHFAAQVAVTTSVVDPIEDFQVNAGGTLNLLEAIRARGGRIPLLYTSTNKVYGPLSDLSLHEEGGRYVPDDASIASHGLAEDRRLEFFSPYGCSKGAADQYVLDYARIFGMETVVFRMSCIYGPRQFGNEDQGWVAHFARAVAHGDPVHIYGDGRQVRDLLFIDDLVDALLLAQANIERLSGLAFNVGGGPDNSVSLLDVLQTLAQADYTRVTPTFHPWRPGDQRYYVSDTRKFRSIAGWEPKVDVETGLRRLSSWLAEPVPTKKSIVLPLEGGTA